MTSSWPASAASAASSIPLSRSAVDRTSNRKRARSAAITPSRVPSDSRPALGLTMRTAGGRRDGRGISTSYSPVRRGREGNQLTEPIVIDTKMHGFSGITAAFLLQGETTALIETGPRSSIDNVLDGLAAAKIEQLDWIIVTHIHLDHAGAAGTLLQHFPAATVAVH